jgi:hypothetical protein
MTDPSRDVILEAAHFLVEIGNSRHARLSGMLSIRSNGCHAGEGGSFSFEVPRAMPTIGLPLRLRPRVPHDEIERGQDSHSEYQYRGDRNHGFGHATNLITASASAQTPIHSASTAIARRRRQGRCRLSRLSLTPPYSVKRGNRLIVLREQPKRDVCFWHKADMGSQDCCRANCPLNPFRSGVVRNFDGQAFFWSRTANRPSGTPALCFCLSGRLLGIICRSRQICRCRVGDGTARHVDEGKAVGVP